MARRREGRELFEVFREAKSAQQGTQAEHRSFASPDAAEVDTGVSPHRMRLGDRALVVVTMSRSWAYGLIFFLFLALLGAFILGWRTAPVPEPVSEVEAPEEFAGTASGVGDIARARESEPRTLAPSAGEGTVGETAGEEPARVGVVTPVVRQGMYTLVVATYGTKELHRELAAELAEFLKGKNLSDVQVVRSSTRTYVTVGSFETSRGEGAQRVKTRVHALSFKNTKFGDAYFESVNKL